MERLGSSTTNSQTKNMPLDRWPNKMATRSSVGVTGLQLASAIARLIYPKDKSMSLSSVETHLVKKATIAKILGLATSIPAYSMAQSDAAIVAQQLNLSERW